MEFKSLRNIESSFRQIRLFGIVFLSLCAVVTVWSVWNSYRFAEKQREKIYVLDNGKVAGSGTHKELLESNDIYKRLWQISEDSAAWNVVGTEGGAV